MAEISKELKRLVEENAIAFATADESGNPHCIAVGFAKVVSGNQILVTDNYMGWTPKNIQRNRNVALAVWNRNWEDDCVGYELTGTAEYFKEGKWLDAVKQIPENRGEPCKGAVLVKVNKIKKLA